MGGPMNDLSMSASDPATDPGLRVLRQQRDAVSSRDFGRLLGRWRVLSRRPDEKKLAVLTSDIERLRRQASRARRRQTRAAAG
jgi:ATP-dependent helicase HrpA